MPPVFLKRGERSSQSVASPVPVLQLLREEVHLDTDDHFFVFNVQTSAGPKEIRVGCGMLRNPRNFVEYMTGKGMLGSAPDNEQVAGFLESKVHPAVHITRRAGWYNNTLVTRSGVYSASPRPTHLFDSANPHYREASREGDLQKYLKALEPILNRSPELTFAYALALVPPLAARIDVQEGGCCVCFVGESSTGKTSSIRLAQSLSARAREKDLINFGDTEGVVIKGIVENGAQLTGFGDIKKSRDKIAGKLRTMIFNATDGNPRRGERDARALTASYNLYFISAEVPLSELFIADGYEYQEGELSRLIEIRLANREQGGIFEGTPPGERQQLIASLEETLKENYGVVMPRWVAFLRHLEPDDADVIKHATEFRQHLASVHQLDDIELRVAKHFELIYAAGCLAYEVGASPTPTERLREVVLEIFQRFLTERNRKSTSIGRPIERILQILLDESRFPLVAKGDPCPPEVGKRGFRRMEADGVCLYVNRAYLVGELTGPTSRQLDEILGDFARRNILHAVAGGGYTQSVQQKGVDRRPRMLRFDDAALKGEVASKAIPRSSR